jgi:hypothetical protein
MEDAATNSPDPILCECGNPECPGRVPYVWPFKLNADTTGGTIESLVGYYSVRTDSSSWGGERTDLHDLFSLLLALLLRAREVASVFLISELNGFSGIDSEIYARIVALRQEGSLAPLHGRAYFEMLSAQSRAAHDMVLDIFGIPAAGPSDWHDGEACYKNPPTWVGSVRKRLRLKTVEDWEFNYRKSLNSRVFTSVKRGVSVIELGKDRILSLRRWMSEFLPPSVVGPTRMSFRSKLLVNAVPNARLKEAKALLKKVEPDANDLLIVPFDSHFVVIGHTALVALTAECGPEAYHSERIAIEARRDAEAEVFLQDVDVVWADTLDDRRFEEMIGELIARERGVQRIRQVGSTRESDDGRDFIVEWAQPPSDLVTAGIADGAAPFLELRQVIIQVKIRTQGVGRSHLPGLRDTLEHYRCSGLLVVAYPNVTTTLSDHLTELRRGGQFWIDWWNRSEIDQRVRRFPDVAARFSDLVTLRRPSV